MMAPSTVDTPHLPERVAPPLRSAPPHSASMALNGGMAAVDRGHRPTGSRDCSSHAVRWLCRENVVLNVGPPRFDWLALANDLGEDGANVSHPLQGNAERDPARSGPGQASLTSAERKIGVSGGGSRRACDGKLVGGSDGA